MSFKFYLILVAGLFFSFNVFAQKKYIAPALSNHGSWSMILVPDPQSYVKFERNQPILELMTSWIKDNISPLNIKLVLCTGDLVEQNEMINPEGTKVNQPSKLQWESVARSFSKLDGHVPFITAAGNHDYGYANISSRNTNFNKYFPIDKNFQTQKLVREVAQNAERIPTLENAAFDFTSPHERNF